MPLPWAGRESPPSPPLGPSFFVLVSGTKRVDGAGARLLLPQPWAVSLGGEGGEWANTGRPGGPGAPTSNLGPWARPTALAAASPGAGASEPLGSPARAPTACSATAQKHKQPPSTRVHGTGAAARPGTRPAWPSRPASDSVTSPSPFHSPRLNRGKVEKSKGSTQVRGEEGVLGLWSFCPKFLGPPPRPAPIPVTSPQPLPPPPTSGP